MTAVDNVFRIIFCAVDALSRVDPAIASGPVSARANAEILRMVAAGVISGKMAKIGPAALLNLAAVLSISVGLLNLLPIPLLDGGHLAYYAIEAVQGKALNERAKQFGFDIGLFSAHGIGLCRHLQ